MVATDDCFRWSEDEAQRAVEQIGRIVEDSDWMSGWREPAKAKAALKRQIGDLVALAKRASARESKRRR